MKSNKKKILIVTNMYPHKEKPVYGIFVKEQMEAIQKKDSSFNFDVMFIKGYKSTLNYLKAIFKLRRIVKKGNYDLIHAHYGLSGLISIFQWRKYQSYVHIMVVMFYILNGRG